ncbi:glycosyltransferase family 2 protein [Epilithonimonas hominis]|uniref:Glycosyltransferase involved in cell wall bisynthesis n=1 Tax=Epilithonimonas hominis TaxID=420404 RepID=A0A1H6IIS8_9FLAO|nr:glycosyltransferase family A protein [Epilithonimonas hominis]SEH47802.1 Glycosyltransferase involved in cell wall bisynthesis [Epilithonimonas hominis]
MLISIVIPCHNCSATIHRAVESVFSQTYTDWELIMVNNNSTDDTWVKLINIKKNNPDKAITVLDEKKKGAPAARNKGLYEAKGEWIQFLDADDELLPNKLEKQIQQISDNVDALYSPYYSIKTKDTEQSYIILDDVWKALLMSKIGITSSNLFRKIALLEIGGWDEKLSSSQDAKLVFDMLKNNKIYLPVDILQTNVFATETSITRTHDKEKIKIIIKNYIDLRKDILQFLSNSGKNLTEYQRIYNRVFADCYLWYFENAPFFTFTDYNKKTKDNLVNRLKTNYSFFRKILTNPNLLKNIN